ncbi:hypothetical protein BJV74DRAFT_867737 [Russula compacta]|nr:hypothetical protein BJV74DRAFT_867737 [Russula compacta]
MRRSDDPIRSLSGFALALCKLRFAVHLSQAYALSPPVRLIFPFLSSYLRYLSLAFVLCLLTRLTHYVIRLGWTTTCRYRVGMYNSVTCHCFAM